ncbi:PHP domain-containing protein [Candidatus Clostridium stratigraminis]|uniref:PHP domain-containing protein n=1 Tax=Candidatus Clostridium stratigraminis TaxID=3381661 RepID=A0ABW8T4B7_9CLOT
MQFSDLHIHSRYSDGALWPEEIIKISYNKGLKCISITDHDTIDSQNAIDNITDNFEVKVIPGVELSTEYLCREIHILGYFIDYKNIDLISNLEKVKVYRKNRAIDIISKLQLLNMNISFDEISINNSCIGRPHIAKALVAKGYVNNTKEAFHQFLIKGKPAYVERYKINYKDALKLICNCGGVPVLAHPGEVYKGIQIEALIKEFKVYGLKGLEVYHPAHSITQTNKFYNLAKKYSLAITGGSDCHGVEHQKELLLGSCGLSEELTNKFLKLKYT